MDVVERLSPEQAREPTLLALTHVHRYELAAGLCAGKRVLDLCCGTGYGAKILAREAASVHGVDIDGPAIEQAATEAEALATVSFERADALEVLERPLEETFDVIVLLEGLEHLQDLERALTALRARTDAGVGLVVSLPNTRSVGERNPHHVTEFDYESALAALERAGAKRHLLQFHAEGSLIGPPGEAEVDATLSATERAEPEHCNHVIGIAGLDRDRTSARMQLSVAPAPNTYMLQLEEANRRLWRTNLRLGRERIGIADSAAAAAVERLRRADELADEATRSRAGALRRLGQAVKRALAFIVPHGLIVLQQQAKTARQREREDAQQSG